MKIRPVILSGGSGTRLWPVSRAKFPKQFIPLIGDESLLSETLRSVADPSAFAPPMIVGNCEHKFLIQDRLEETGTTPALVLLEPCARNTAVAALVAALAETQDDVLHLVRPSDHLIADPGAWHDALAKAVRAAAAGFLVLFGIAPDHPETGYGYILRAQASDFMGVDRIAAFKEKPDTPTATQLIAEGALWNSGIFLYAPRALIEEARLLAPELLTQAQAALDKAQNDPRGLKLDAETYANIPAEPFDRVIMERTTRGAVVPCGMGWNDVGSWQALWQTADKNNDGNFLSDSVIALDTARSYIRSEGPKIAVLGMQDVAVIATKDAVLVTPLARTQDIKRVVTALEKAAPDLTQEHPRARRPWGSYETLAQGAQFQVKRIIVLPGRALSLQMHQHRAEHWIVVEGVARVECDALDKLVHPNESVYIPKGAKHRLTNPGTRDLCLIEVQSGAYLGEDDIVRFADHYGRDQG